MKVCDLNVNFSRNDSLAQETLAVLKSVQEVFEKEEGPSKGVFGEEVKRVCQAEDLAILHDMLPHITSLMDWAVKQEAIVRVVTHGDFHQWNMAFDSEHPFP